MAIKKYHYSLSERSESKGYLNVCLRQAQAIYKNILDCIFPPLCYSCFSHLKKNEKELNVCESCAAKIQVHSSLFCPVCKSRIPITYQLKNLQTHKPNCHPNAPFLLAACSDYGNPAVKELLHTFKYKKIENAIRPITKLLIKPYLKTIFPELCRRDTILVPIPLHASKKRSRGFNQSELIAQCLETELLNVNPQTLENWKLKIENSALKRVRQTDPQAETKNAKERHENVRDCFSINPELVEGLPYRNIVLVDDVYTSGATMAEAVRVLKNAGAKHILAFVLAKA